MLSHGVLMWEQELVFIAANKVPGVIAAVCSEPYSAKLQNSITTPTSLHLARVVGVEPAKMILDEFFWS